MRERSKKGKKEEKVEQGERKERTKYWEKICYRGKRNKRKYIIASSTLLQFKEAAKDS